MQDQSFQSYPRGPQRGTVRRDPKEPGVIDFASWVVELIAARKAQGEAPLRPDVLDAFLNAAVADDPAHLAAFLRDLVRMKMPPSAVADVYIPAVARELGRAWLDDRLSFLQVSVGSARLQSMLRAIGHQWTADTGAVAHSGALLLVLPPHEQHTLGAMVLMGQLRRLGVSVRLAIGPSKLDLQRIFSQSRYDGVLISVAASGRLAELSGFVQQIRRAGWAGLPVVVGGPLLATEADLAARVGADAEATTLSAALRICGLAEGVEGRRRRA